MKLPHEGEERFRKYGICLKSEDSLETVAIIPVAHKAAVVNFSLVRIVDCRFRVFERWLAWGDSNYTT